MKKNAYIHKMISAVFAFLAVFAGGFPVKADVVPEYGGTFTVTLPTSWNWTASTTYAWISLPETSNTGSKVSYTVGTNTETSIRSGTIKIVNTFTQGYTNVTVRQSANGSTRAIFLPETAQKVASGENNSLSFPIIANTDWTVTKDSSTWVDLTTTSGSGNGTVDYRVTENTTSSDRSCTLTVKVGQRTGTMTITQVGSGTANPVIPGFTAYEISSAGGEVTLTVNQNCSASIAIGGKWVALDKSTVEAGGTLTCTLQANTSETRSCTINLKLTASSTYTHVVITQYGPLSDTDLALETGPQKIKFSGGSTNFWVSSLGIWSAKKTDDWITLTQRGGFGEGEVVYTVQSNNTTAARSGTITVTSGTVTKTLTVTQNRYYSLPEALDAANLAFTQSGDADWFGQPDVTHDGTDAAQSGDISLNGSSSFETELTGAPGKLSFYWKTTAANQYTSLALLIGGTQVTNISGNTDWTQVTLAVTNNATVQWIYKNNGSGAASGNGFVDEMSWSQLPASLVINGQDSVVSDGAANYPYTCSAVYPDGTTGLVDVAWSLAEPSAYVALSSSGTLASTNRVTVVTNATLVATYSLGFFTKTVSKTVKVTPEEMTVAFAANGGVILPATGTYYVGAVYGSLPTPYYMDYSFTGWFTAVSGGTQIMADTIATNNVTTLYAQWVDDPLGKLNSALDCTNLTFTSGDCPGWLVETNTSIYGGSAAQSGAITNGQNSWMQTTVVGPGLLAFQWKVSHAEGHTNTLSFYINGILTNQVGNECSAEAQVSYRIGSGTNTLRWVFTTDSAAKNSDDYGVVDYIIWDRELDSLIIHGQDSLISGPSSRTDSYACDAIFTDKTMQSSVNAVFSSYIPESGVISFDSANKEFYTSDYVVETQEVAIIATYKHSVGSIDITCVTTNWVKILPKEVTIYFDANGEGASVTPQSKICFMKGIYGWMPTPLRMDYSFLNWFTLAAGGSIKRTNEVLTTVSPTNLYAHWVSCEVKVNDGVDNTNLTFSIGGDIGWYGEKDDVYSGGSAVRSRAINNAQTNWLQTTLKGAGVLSFYWKVSSEGSHANSLSLLVNDSETAGIGSESNTWAKQTCRLPSGTNIVKWAFTTDSATASSNDYGAVDAVVWSPDVASLAIVGPGVVQGGSNFQYTCNAIFTDDTTQQVNAVWSLAPASSFVSLDASSGAVTSTGVTEKQVVTATASYTTNDLTTTASRTLQIQPTAGIIDVVLDAGDGTSSTNTFTIGDSFGSALPAAPVRYGYVFTGWHRLSARGELVTGSTTVTDQDTELYAGWMPQVVCITFDANGGTVSPVTRSNTVNQAYGALPAPSRNGYDFDAWYNALVGGELVTAASTVTNSDTTLYARWVAQSVALDTALDASPLSFTTGGDAAWFGQTNSAYFGGSAAQCGAVTNGQSTWIQTTVSGAGALSFYWKIASANSNFGTLLVVIDGVTNTLGSSATDWTQQSYPLAGGNHTLTWIYQGGSDLAGYALVDKLSWSHNLASIAISGPAVAAPGANISYVCTATYTDGSNQTVTAEWSLSPLSTLWGINASTGVVTIDNAVSQNAVITITALYSENGVTNTAATTLTIQIPAVDYSAYLTTGGSADANAFAGKAVYNGWLWAVKTVDTQTVATVLGTVQVKSAKLNKKGISRVTASITMLGAKLSLKGDGTVDGSGTCSATLTGRGKTMTVNLRGDRMWGALDDMTLDGARNVFQTKGDAKANALSTYKGVWTAALDGQAVSGSGTVMAEGLGAFYVNVGTKGKTKVSGVLADGTKVNVSSQLVFIDGANGCAACVPVFVQLYSKKGGFGTLLWLGADGSMNANEDIGWGSYWKAASKVASFEALLALGGQRLVAASGALTFTLHQTEAVPLYSGTAALDALYPVGVPVQAAARWTLPKAGKIAKDGTYTGDNPSGLKLTYTSKTGLFKGSFTVYYLVNGKLKKVKAVVNGAVVGGAGYGSAVINKSASLPVSVQ